MKQLNFGDCSSKTQPLNLSNTSPKATGLVWGSHPSVSSRTGRSHCPRCYGMIRMRQSSLLMPPAAHRAARRRKQPPTIVAGCLKRHLLTRDSSLGGGEHQNTSSDISNFGKCGPTNLLRNASLIILFSS